MPPHPVDVLLATCAALPDGEPGGHLLAEALAARGLTSRWAAWDDPAVDWSAARVVAVRSTWDYTARRDEFLAWARGVGPSLLNGAEVLAWNTDKSYLLDLQDAGLPVVPTRIVAAGDLPRVLVELGGAVVKPTVGASGRGVQVAEPGTPVDGPGPWVVQPLVASVRTEGETSVFVLGGRVAGQVRKTPAAGGSILVHEQYGGRTVAEPVGDEHAALALRAVEVVERLRGVRLDYARVDQMRLADGRLVVGEVEAVEPGLYLDVLPGGAAAFADAVHRRLKGEAGER